MKRTIPIIGTKSSLVWDEDTDAWTYYSGSPLTGGITAYYSLIPTLYRAIDKRAKSISSLPWAILNRNDEEVDSSEAYENNTGLVNNMSSLLWLIEAALSLCGESYLGRGKNIVGYDKVFYYAPSTISVDAKETKLGMPVFYRQVGTQKIRLTSKEIIYIWQPDPMVEFGPPTVSAAGSALAACGVLANMDEFARNFFGRGAIKAMLFAMQGAPKSEAEKFEAWWQKYVSGIKNAFRTKVINADKVEPVIVGEGIKELENVTIAKDKQEEIAIALDIPFSMLFSDASNYATAERDKLNWYEDFVVPEANFIASALNEQLYKPLGLKLVFKPETLDIFQEDENERAAAMSQFMDAIDKAGSFEMAQALCLIYGVEIPDEAMALIEKHFANKQKKADEIAENMEDKPVEEQPQEEAVQEPPQPEKKVNLYWLTKELDIWETKCIKALKRGEDADSVPFVCEAVPPDMAERIRIGLSGAKSANDIKKVFMRETNRGQVKQEGEFDGIIGTLREAMTRLDAVTA